MSRRRLQTPEDQCLIDIPSPIVQFSRVEKIQASSYSRYWIAFLNHTAYPDSLFVKAPHLPPCGWNTKASRTWINIHNGADNSSFYTFCALDTMPSEVWFAARPGAVESVYIVLNDRECNASYTSNNVSLIDSTGTTGTTLSLASSALETLPMLPNPVIFLDRFEKIEESDHFRYWVGFQNYLDYPDALFVAAPSLPPCGSKNDPSRMLFD